jgi:hypothetical protein
METGQELAWSFCLCLQFALFLITFNRYKMKKPSLGLIIRLHLTRILQPNLRADEIHGAHQCQGFLVWGCIAFQFSTGVQADVDQIPQGFSTNDNFFITLDITNAWRYYIDDDKDFH